jgi:hypothetical protein
MTKQQTMTYESESRALDEEILAIIAAWRECGETLDDLRFNDLALRLFAYQLRYNEPYARYCKRLGVTLEKLPASWEEIPAAPAPAFKEATLAAFPPSRAALVFETSGTTSGLPGRHYFETPALYDAALLAGFDRFVLPDGARLRYLNCVPNPLDTPHSSLGYMMARVAKERGDGKTGWYLRDGALLFDDFKRDLRQAIGEKQPVCLAATAFALVHLLEALEREGRKAPLPPGSRLMETGGFKGRSRSVSREELYSHACDRLCIPPSAIVAEYGMTELTSQYYDRLPDDGPLARRRKVSPPWLRARVVGPDRSTLPPGETGSLLHLDLANRGSSLAVQTEDLAVQYADGFVLLGRASDAEPRGCSLDAEDLRERARERSSV